VGVLDHDHADDRPAVVSGRRREQYWVGLCSDSPDGLRRQVESLACNWLFSTWLVKVCGRHRQAVSDPRLMLLWCPGPGRHCAHCALFPEQSGTPTATTTTVCCNHNTSSAARVA
jgi:hypothetical protein